ncbi:MAG: YjfB family protein [Anaerolineaceae bacterium]|nr:YjfB family protein [Anaerolineaceae bacterium]
MNISGVSDLSTVMASTATTMKAGQVQQAIQADILKQTLDQQKAAGAELLQMLDSSPTPRAVGGNVDISI